MDTLLEPDELKIAEAISFLHSFRSVILGTVSPSGRPHTSYAPYINDAGNFYVYVSGLAQHAHTLRSGKASLLFIENEEQAKTIFARRRLSIDCEVSEIRPDQRNHKCLLDQLENRHGSTVKLLRALPDFLLFELSPAHASYVTGFGAAYNLTASLPDLTRVRSSRNLG